MKRTLVLLALSALGLAALPAHSATAPSPSPSYVPIEAPRPSWYTDELHARVLAAGPTGVPLPDEADVPTGGLAFTGIRPGSWMIFPVGCTMNFVFGTPGSYYIGTAGHCTEKVGEDITLVTVGPTSPRPILVNIGKTVSTTGDAGPGNDFALVSIHPELQSWVSPSMAHWGGPTAAYTGGPVTGLVHSGHGLVIGTGGTARAAAGLYFHKESNTRHTAYWAGATIFGDSGSAINTATGQAYANITHLVVNLRFPGADSAGTHIARIQALAGKPLATCRVAVPWPLPGCPPL